MIVGNAETIVDSFKEGLTYDDVNLYPEISSIKSRSDIDLDIPFGPEIVMNPLIPANMDSICGPVMAALASDYGTIGFLHRFGDRLNMLEETFGLFGQTPAMVGVSLGGNEPLSVVATIVKKFNQLKYQGIDPNDSTLKSWRDSNYTLAFLIDVAHGHHWCVIDTIKTIKKAFPNIVLIAGNVATKEGARRLLRAGADGIKVGVGNGSLCETRIRTGFGVPQFTAVAECARVIKADFPGKILIADGGIKYVGDIVKAIGAGADLCMSGYLFAGTKETPGQTVPKGLFPNEREYKIYRGSASRSSKLDRGENNHIEGNVVEIPLKGSARYIFEQVEDGVRSGLSYAGCSSLSEFKGNGLFCKVSPSSIIEAQPNAMRMF